MPADLTIVLDTNVWISGIFFRRGIPARILAAWCDHRFEVVVTPDTLTELETQLRQKTIQFEANPTLADEWLDYVRTYARQVPPAGVAAGVCRDPKDDQFLDAAISGGARYIVPGDKDLQALDTYQRVKVLSPREFVELMGL
ncbi:MAG TPA: putative toxin-antitoxin system toxin component, PIN family [Anaerolineae bacterium]|nr:putative toxin-antitoxin system toxin component, PIN family [Anaerolineae bacterium]